MEAGPGWGLLGGLGWVLFAGVSAAILVAWGKLAGVPVEALRGSAVEPENRGVGVLGQGYWRWFRSELVVIMGPPRSRLEVALVFFGC